MEEHAQKLVALHTHHPVEPRPSMLRRIDTVPLSSSGVVAPTFADAATSTVHGGLKSAQAGEALMSSVMSSPQNTWADIGPTGVAFEGSGVSYNPHHETAV